VTVLAATEAEGRVASVVTDALGDRPLLLCGSRALGTAHARSDYDVVVVLPARSVPLRLRRLKPLADRLASELGAPISVNPLPESRLRKSRSLYVWKLRREARILAAPGSFGLGEAGPAPLGVSNEFSYLASASLYLLSSLSATGDPRMVASGAEVVEHGVRKCLLHLAQLRLMRQGRYASSLEEAVGALGDRRLARLAAASGEDRLFAVRDELAAELDGVLPGIEAVDVLATNARYAALAALRGRNRVRALLLRRRIDALLVETAGMLLGAIRPGGEVDGARVPDALVRLPLAPAGPARGWQGARDAVLREWPDAHPLGAQ
jgi:Nucleotidyltransferase domain